MAIKSKQRNNKVPCDLELKFLFTYRKLVPLCRLLPLFVEGMLIISNQHHTVPPAGMNLITHASFLFFLETWMGRRHYTTRQICDMAFNYAAFRLRMVWYSRVFSCFSWGTAVIQFQI